MALDCRFTLGLRVRRGVPLRMGLRTDGHGTPAPMIPPKKLVVVGFYRYVRNPMYLGFITGWIGLWIVFGQANLVAIVIAFAVVLGVALFVVHLSAMQHRSGNVRVIPAIIRPVDCSGTPFSEIAALPIDINR